MITFTSFTWIIVAAILLNFLFEAVPNFLNIKHSTGEIPNSLQGIYDETEYQKQQIYLKVNQKFDICVLLATVVFNLAFLVFGGFAYINTIALSLFFFGVVFVLDKIVSIPFEIYETFVIEEKFGFNTTTKLTFVLDEIKSFLFVALFGGLLLTLFEVFFLYTPALFWAFSCLTIIVILLFANAFFSTLFVPLFYKQTPLEQCELRDRILSFAESVGFEIDNVFIIDASKRTNKSNAYFTGFGKRKRIVLYDTMLNELTPDEIVAVLAHEIGHYKNRHIWKNFAMSIINVSVMLFFLGFCFGNNTIANALGVANANFHINMCGFSLLYTPLTILIGLVTNAVSRKHEREADAFAVEHGYGTQLIESLKKLSKKSLGNLNPHPLYVAFNYSHPTLGERIESIQTLEKQQNI